VSATYISFPRFKPNEIFNALFSLLKTAAYPFVTFSQRGATPENIDTALQPYLALIPLGAGQVENQAQGIEKWIFEYACVVYIRAVATPETIPAIELNKAFYAIVNVMRSTPPFSQQTLGGLVDNAWIEGECMFNTGILDEQCRLLVPIKVVLGG
jgi:hypothetical protein